MRILALVAILSGCGDDGGSGGVHVIAEVGAEAPDYGRAPFPTDAVRDGAHIGVFAGLEGAARGHADVVGAHLAALDGFGLRPVVEFFVDGALDPASIPTRTTLLGETAAVLDIDPASPQLGRVIAMDWRYDAERNVIAGSPVPGNQLREGTRYAAVLTTEIRAVGGAPIARMAAFGDSAPERWRSTAEAYVELAGRAELTNKLAGIAVFTTQHATKVLLAAREVLAAAPRPTVVFDRPAIIFDTAVKLDALLGQATRVTGGPRDGLERWGTDNATGMAHDHIGLVATGRMPIARFRGDDTGTDGPEDETFQLGADGIPRIIAMETIAVSFVLPKGPVPAAGFPVVIFGHGLGGSRHGMLNLAEPLTAQGYAIVAIDMWGHGSRYADVDGANNLGGKMAFTGNKLLPDGFGDDPGYAAYLDFFEGFLNVAAIRDAIRQSALDFTQLATLVSDPAIDLTALAAPYGAAPRFDTRHVAYLGESFGTIVGTDVAALEPSVQLFVLDVPGGGLLDQIFPNSATIGALAIPFVEGIYRTTGKLDRFHPLLAMMQNVFDGADPLSFAPHVLRDRFTIAGTPLSPRNVVAIEVIGDEIMANAGTSALAAAFGLQVLTPAFEVPAGLVEIAAPAAGNIDGQTGVLVQYAPATHGYNWSAERGNLAYVPGFPHPDPDPYPKLPASIEITEPIYETLEQVVEILATYQAGAAPRVISTLPPIHDFDGDGRLDEVDPDPFDPTK